MAKMKKSPPPPGKTGRRRRRAWWIAGAVGALAVVVLGWFAYQSQASLPATPVPSQGNAHLSSSTAPHLPYNIAAGF